MGGGGLRVVPAIRKWRVFFKHTNRTGCHKDDDVIVGSFGMDSIGGLGGNDRICGLGGDDFMSGGLGDDRVDAGPGSDRAGGDFGTVDTLAGTIPRRGFALDGGDDLLILGPGDDGSTGDHFRVAEGEVSGDGGKDMIDGGPGLDSLWVTTRAVP